MAFFEFSKILPEPFERMPVDLTQAALVDRYLLGIVAGERAHDILDRADRRRARRIGRGKDSFRYRFEDAQLRGFENSGHRPRRIVGLHASDDTTGRSVIASEKKSFLAYGEHLSAKCLLRIIVCNSAPRSARHPTEHLYARGVLERQERRSRRNRRRSAPAESARQIGRASCRER